MQAIGNILQQNEEFLILVTRKAACEANSTLKCPRDETKSLAQADDQSRLADAKCLKNKSW